MGFRPLSGIYGSKLACAYAKYIYPIVSVPFRGSMVLNAIIQLWKQLRKNSFRPLSGIYGSKLWFQSYKENKNIVSVPFRGSMVLNNLLFLLWSLLITVSVPFRGSMVLNICGFPIWYGIYSFRPLSGIYGSKQCSHWPNAEKYAKFPSPFGDLWF